MDNNDVKIAGLYTMAEKVVAKYHVYGVECLFRAAINAAIKEPYVDEALLHDLVSEAYQLLRKEEKDELSNK